MKNVYNTTDPQKLLELRRLEARALLDVIRTINHNELNLARSCKIVSNVLRAQLGVKKMALYCESEGDWFEGFLLGFELVSDVMFSEMIQVEKITKVDESFPFLFEKEIEYIVPVVNPGSAKVYFLIADFADSDIEAQNDLIFIETIGNILSVAITNKQLFKEKVAQEFLRKELEVAETIQKQLLISDFSKFREIDVFGMNLAHHGIGGDFYDVIKKEKGTTFLCIADVSGKGIGAALLMSNLQANLRALCAQYNDLKEIIGDLNRILFEITTGEKFVTLFLAKIDTKKKEVTYINAGHNYPVFINQNGPVRLSEGCMLLGIMPALTIEEESFPFEEGDLLFTFTDGVVEQHEPGGQMFGSERVVQELVDYKYLSSRQIISHIYEKLLIFANNAGTEDDITMLSVKF
ncbi:MAG: serine/threonine-protein phosphatase [Bacteroidetes bacterium]|nr:serine/threonine-protein phosphatase [Bacteroidota bacterium]MCB0851798.1 serine/threonine-protein phosphatase [Bacteroidota bacterium]